MAELKHVVNDQISAHDMDARLCTEHSISVSDIVQKVKELKHGKHDGNHGHYSDHLINGTIRLHVYLCLLFNSMISHGFVPQDFLLSTLVPIPKNEHKSLNDSDKYRAIGLSSILGKLLDKIILHKSSHAYSDFVFQRFVVNFLECTCLCYSG